MVGLDKERAFMDGGDIGGTDFDGGGSAAAHSANALGMDAIER